MITPIIIQILFWLGTLGCVLIGTRLILASLDAPRVSAYSFDGEVSRLGPRSSGFSTFLFAQGVVTLIVGPLVLRVLCELDIILFKIHDELKEANNRGRYRD